MEIANSVIFRIKELQKEVNFPQKFSVIYPKEQFYSKLDLMSELVLEYPGEVLSTKES